MVEERRQFIQSTNNGVIYIVYLDNANLLTMYYLPDSIYFSFNYEQFDMNYYFCLNFIRTMLRLKK